MLTENMNGTNGHNGVGEEKGSNGTGIAPGLKGEYTDPHLKAQRDYESDYAKLALKGGHKGLLSMNEENSAKIPTLDDVGRRQKGCDNLSAYNKIALQGGHKDLLKIDGNSETNGTPIKTTGKKQSTQSPRKCGDWYGSENGHSNNNNTPSKKPTSPEPRIVTPIRDQRRSHGNCIVPGGDQEPQRFGKKRFNNPSQRQEAPFATNY
jgi:hypothetical protein